MPSRCRSRAHWKWAIAVFLCYQVYALMIGFDLNANAKRSSDGILPRGREHPSVYRSTEIKSVKSANVITSLPTLVEPVKFVESTQAKTTSTADQSALQSLRQQAAARNAEQRILNADKFGPVAPDDVVVVVQVHTRIAELELFLSGLSKARQASSILLIISMDFITPELDSLVVNITFCKVLPIYFPHSVQMFPNEFPGSDPRDCPAKTKPSRAKAMGCQNAEYPDKYGNYREAGITATKHHWWWKCTFVFEHVPALKSHTGLKLFVEEDHYIAPDFIAVLDLMQSHVAKIGQRVDFYGLGRQRRVLSRKPGTLPRFAAMSSGSFSEFEIGPWQSSVHNMGFAFNRATWESLKACFTEFCTYDDYNWDWTLHHLGSGCLKQPLTFIGALAPRVYHFGMCGVHFKLKNCNPADALVEYTNFLDSNKAVWYPTQVTRLAQARPTIKFPQPFGGWGDPRDVKLCLSFAK